MTYSPLAYWTERGKTHEAEALREGWSTAENPELLALLDTLTFSTVLEIGCGFGRVGTSLMLHYPGIAYTGIDISADLIAGARKRLPDAELLVADIATWESERTWDLVIAIGVLGHILPQDIENVIGKMLRGANRDVVNIDWNDVGASTAYQYGHDYRSIYGVAAETVPNVGQVHRARGDGRMTMWHVARPPRLDP